MPAKHSAPPWHRNSDRPRLVWIHQVGSIGHEDPQGYRDGKPKWKPQGLGWMQFYHFYPPVKDLDHFFLPVASHFFWAVAPLDVVIPWQVTVESTPADPLDGSCVRYWFQNTWTLQCIYSQINIDPAKQVGLADYFPLEHVYAQGLCWFAGLFSASKTSVPKSREESLQDWFPSEDHWTSPSHLQMSSSRKLVPTTPSS